MDRRQDTGQAGFTLVELIVAFSVGLIVIAITTALLISGTNMAQHTTQRALDEQILDGVFSFAEKRLRFASSVEERTKDELATAKEQVGGLLYIGNAAGSTAEKGMLFFRHTTDANAGVAPSNVMGEAYYMDNTISLDAKVIQKVGAKPAVYLKLSLYDSDGVLVAERAQTYTLINGAKAEADSTASIQSPNFLYFGFAPSDGSSPLAGGSGGEGAGGSGQPPAGGTPAQGCVMNGIDLSALDATQSACHGS
jgi:prepilin-type N-terminal cleavage/methylation domain-containing protein